MGRLRSPVMVGREAELRRLCAVSERVALGEAATVVVLGEAGIGKTRLVSEFSSRLRARGWVVCTGHGAELSGGTVPFGTLIETLRGLVHQVGRRRVRSALGSQSAALVPLTPALGASVEQAGERVDIVDRGRVISATADLLAAMAASQPLCWLLEDLHWADPSSRDVFEYVARSSGASRILTVTTSRPLLDRGELLRASFTEVLELSRLTELQAHEQLDHVRADLPQAATDRIVGLSDGVPFHVEELAASWDGTSIAPDYLHRLVLTRLSALSTPSRQLVEAASLGEGHLYPTLLERLGFDAAVQRDAVAAGILEIDGSGEQLRFGHALLREAVEQHLLPAERASGHRRWAGVIAEAGAPWTKTARLTALARHWSFANSPEPAIQYTAEAARAALAAAAPAEAAGHLTRVLDLWEQVAEPEQLTRWTRGEVTVYAIDAVRSAGLTEQAETVVATELARCAARGDVVGFTALRVMQHRPAGPNAVDSDVERRNAITLLNAPEDARAIDALTHLTFTGTLPLDLEDRTAARVREIAEALGSHRLRYRALITGFTIAAHNGRVEQTLEEMRAVEPGLGDLPIQERWFYHCGIMWCLILLGHTREARDQARHDLGLLSRPGALPIQYHWVCHQLGDALEVRGEWEELDQLVDEVWRNAPPPPRDGKRMRPCPDLYLQMSQQRANLSRGRPTDPMVLDSALKTWGGDWGSVRPEIPLAAILAEVYTADGDLPRVRSLLSGAWSLPHPERVCTDLPLAILAALRAETALARRRPEVSLRATRDYAGQVMATAGRLPRQGPRGEAWWLEAQAHAARAHGNDSPDPWAAAAAAWRACEQRPDVSACLTRQGEAYLAHGQREAATVVLQEALQLATELGAHPLVDLITRIGRRAQLEIGTPTVPDIASPGEHASLTVREREVLDLVAQGLSNDEIAEDLFISPKTVSVHVSRILMKLNAANRTAAVLIGRRQNLIDL